MRKTLIPALPLLLLFSPTLCFAATATHSAGSSASIRETQPITRDPRVDKLNSFLENYSSPLTQFSPEFIATADKYNLDWKLLPAIAGVESTFGQHLPANSFNPFGWGIYGDQVLRFNSYPQAIAVVISTLASKYPEDSLSDINHLGYIYNGVTPGSWSWKIKFFMDKIDNQLPELSSLEPSF